MGSFYVNICALDVSQAEMVAMAGALAGPAFVSPTKNNWTCMVSETLDQQDSRIIHAIGKGLARTTKAVSVLNHDSDVLEACVFENGALIGSFQSNPGYFSGNVTPPALEGTAAFAELAGKSVAELKAILLAPDDDGGPYVLAEEYHYRLITLLGLLFFSLDAGYRYVAEAGGAGWQPVNQQNPCKPS